MAAEEELNTALTGSSEITAITADRIYADVRDQEDDVPAIFFQRSETSVINNIHGTARVAEIAIMVVVCFESSREKASALADLVITAANAAGFIYIDRRGDYDSDVDVYASILQFQHNEG